MMQGPHYDKFYIESEFQELSYRFGATGWMIYEGKRIRVDVSYAFLQDHFHVAGLPCAPHANRHAEGILCHAYAKWNHKTNHVIFWTCKYSLCLIIFALLFCAYPVYAGSLVCEEDKSDRDQICRFAYFSGEIVLGDYDRFASLIKS